MEALQLVLPALATAALGTALLVPLREERSRRAAASRPLRPDFAAVVPAADPAVATVPERSGAAALAGAEDDGRRPKPVPRGPSVAGMAGSITFARTRLENAVARLCRRPSLGASSETGDATAPERSEDEIVVAERSFASELAALLPQPPPADAYVALPDDGLLLRTPPLRTSAEDVGEEAYRARRTPTAAPEGVVAPGAVPVHRVERRAAVEAASLDEDGRLEAVPFPVNATASMPERVVPLTRLPLRKRSAHVLWPNAGAAGGGAMDRAQRHAYLAAVNAPGDREVGDMLVCAYREEDDEGRALAMHALLRGRHAGARDVFVEALRGGRDDERAFAVDALASLGERESVAAALDDRLDAVAARAALVLVGPASASDYRRVLGRHVEPARIETILDLLAGVLE